MNLKKCIHIGLLSLTLASPFASIRPADAKPKPPEAKGLEAGGVVMHPGAEFALAYESISNQSKRDGRADIAVKFSSRLADETTRVWNSNVSLAWQQYWGLGENKPNGGINAVIATNADLFKLGLFRLAPSFSYSYLEQPEDENLRQDLKNHSVRAGVGLTIQPGQGEIFSERLSYAMSGHIYPDHSDISNFVHKIESVTRWNFLPNSSMALTVNVSVSHFLEKTRKSSSGANLVNENENAKGYPVRAKYSLQGLLLPRMTYILALGYAYAYYTTGSEHMFIMNAKLGYSFRDNIELALEYRKDFETAVYGDYYKLNRVALTFDALWFERLRTKAEAGFGAFGFVDDSTMIRIDYLTTLRASADYYFLPGLRLGISYQFSYNASDVGNAQYSKHAALLNLAYEY